MNIAICTPLFEGNERLEMGYPERLINLFLQSGYAGDYIILGNKKNNSIPGISCIKYVAVPQAFDLSIKSVFWYNYQLPSFLKKMKASLFINTYPYTSYRTQTPQIVFVDKLPNLEYPYMLNANEKRYYKSRFASHIQDAAIIVASSQHIKQLLVKNYFIPDEKIQVIYPAPLVDYKPVSNWTEKENCKLKYTSGCEYFIYYGPMYKRRNVGNLLKAFSIFKKWQNSNMKLVLAGDIPAADHDEELDKLPSYKYKDDVILLNNIAQEELSLLVASAYSLLYPSLYEFDVMPLLNAMACNIPIITGGSELMKEIAGKSALYAEVANHRSIADQMISLYRDEDLHNKLSHNTAEYLVRYNWKHSTDKLWQICSKYSFH